MSTNRRLSGYTLFPTCTPLAVSEDSKENSLQLVGSDNNPASLQKVAALPFPHQVGEQHTANNERSTSNPIVLVNRKLRQRMGRLIPLKLGAQTVTRSLSPPLPLKDKIVQPLKSSKGPRPGPVTHLIILPYTEKEWRIVMNEVKNLYSKGQYKHCSLRCKQILDGIKDSYCIHPLYSIYLAFFAASALEMTASSLHNNSSSKLPLYQEALAYYQKAAAHLQFASFSANTTLINGMSSNPSSTRSSVDSIFSQHSVRSVSSVASSPPLDQERGQERKRSTSRPNSPYDEITPEPLRAKKKVSFSPSTTPSRQMALRPESRGLGVQLMTPTPGIDEAMLLDAFPVPPSQGPLLESEASNATEVLSFEPKEEETPLQQNTLLTYHVSRYRNLLLSLSTQLTYHISSIHSQISILSASRKARRNGLDFAPGVRRMSMEGMSREEIKKTDLRERIERLKAQGWERKRFDCKRYQELAERALEDVGEARI